MRPLTRNLNRAVRRCAAISYLMLTPDFTACALLEPSRFCIIQDEADRNSKPHKQKPAVWQHISRNIYTHRRRKTEKEDDIMICTCPRPADGGPGCGVDCLNRRLAVECHPVSDLAKTAAKSGNTFVSAPRQTTLHGCRHHLHEQHVNVSHVSATTADSARGVGLVSVRRSVQQSDVCSAALC